MGDLASVNLRQHALSQSVIPCWVVNCSMWRVANNRGLCSDLRRYSVSRRSATETQHPF